MAELCAARKAAVVLMHKKGVPLTMQDAPYYDDVIAEVGAYLTAAAEKATAAGITAERIIVDPGIGFGKRHEDNVKILRCLHELTRIPRLAEICGKDYPVMVALSRKSIVGNVLNKPPEERLYGTLAANAAAIVKGAAIIRVHDVKEHLDLVKILFALGS
jgi:dihydropteroate synthase